MASPVNASTAPSSAKAAANESIADQARLLSLSMKLNKAMAYLQMALALSGKLAGR